MQQRGLLWLRFLGKEAKVFDLTEASKILENLEKIVLQLSNTVLTQVIFHNEKMYRWHLEVINFHKRYVAAGAFVHTSFLWFMHLRKLAIFVSCLVTIAELFSVAPKPLCQAYFTYANATCYIFFLFISSLLEKCHSLLSVTVLLAPTRALSVPPRWSFSLELLFWQKPLKMGKLVLLPSNALWTWFASLGEKKFHYLFRPLPLAHFQPKFSKRMF